MTTYRIGSTIYSKHVYYQWADVGLVFIRFYYPDTGVFMVDVKDAPIHSAGRFAKPEELTATVERVSVKRRFLSGF